MLDVIIIGAGPIGLALAIEAKKKALSYTVLEKGLMTNSIYYCPRNSTFFSTADLVEIGSIPFVISGPKPKRSDLLKYYWRVAMHYDLDIQLDCRVDQVAGSNDGFVLSTSTGEKHSRVVILATGFYDNPNYLDVPGEDLPHVSHYYREQHEYVGKKVAVIGGSNSAVEAALELFRYDIDVTLIHRGPGIGKKVKAWVVPDIQNRLKKGEIKSLFNSVVHEITPSSVQVKVNGKNHSVPADAVLALTGYHPNFEFMRQAGIIIDEKSSMPQFDAATGETNVPGLYIAGALQAGRDANKIFIENGRHHAPIIIGAIADRLRQASLV